MYARFFAATVLALALAVTADGPQRPAVLPPEVLGPDTSMPVAWQISVIGDFAIRAPDLESELTGAWALVDLPRVFRDRPDSGIDLTSEEFFDVASRSYVVRYLVAIPLPDESQSIALKVQTNQARPSRGPLDLDYAQESSAFEYGSVTVETRYSGWRNDTLEVALMYRYDTSRAQVLGASLNYTFPDLLPCSLSTKHEVKVNEDYSNQEKVSLSLRSRPRGVGPAHAATLTATIGLGRQDVREGPRWRESYTLDWGGNIQLSERLTAGLNMTYSWDDRGFGTVFFVELKDPPRRLRSILTGAVEPGHP
jgi:hypothetical protein